VAEEDLGALAAALMRRMIAQEEPILQAAGISMWEYIVLDRLGAAPARSQAQLARWTGRDTTRLIAHLDRLEQVGLVERRPVASDRRHNAIALTDAGRVKLTLVKRNIREMEDRVLAAVPFERAATLRADLAAIAHQDESRDEE
jgi:DNA-binding MarR family transcriptional regulator